MIHVITCDPFGVVRRGIREFLAEAVDVRLSGEAASAEELKRLLRTTQCDVLLLALGLPGRSGLDVLADLVEAESPVKVLIYSGEPEGQYAVRCLRAGAYGSLSKAADPRLLVTAVRMVGQGQKYLSPEATQLLADTVARPDAEASPHHLLSNRELETLVRIASGKTMADIAREFMLSPKTVNVYRMRVREKLHLSNDAALTAYAIRNQLI